MVDDISSRDITVRISADLGKRLKNQSTVKGRSQSALVRDALDVYLEKPTLRVQLMTLREVRA